MAKYTTTLYEIAKKHKRDDEDLNNPTDRADIIRRLFFYNKRHIIDGRFYYLLTDLFASHYFLREIGAETPEIFDFYLYDTLLTEKERIEFVLGKIRDILYDEVVEDEFRESTRGTEKKEGNSQGQNTTKSKNANTITGTHEDKNTRAAGSKQESQNTSAGESKNNQTTDIHGASFGGSDGMTTGVLVADMETTNEQGGTGTTTSTTYTPSDFKRVTQQGKQVVGTSLSSTPQGPLEDVRAGKYLTSYQLNESDPTTSTTIESGSHTTTGSTSTTPTTNITHTRQIGRDPEQRYTTNENSTQDQKTTATGDSTTTARAEGSSTGTTLEAGKTSGRRNETQEGSGDVAQNYSGTNNEEGERNQVTHSNRTVKKISREGFTEALMMASPLWTIFDPLFMGLY